jgi:hypothetical protein
MPLRLHPTRFIPLLLILAVLATYAPVTRYDFTNWDDPGTLALNPNLNPPGFRKMLHYWRYPHMGLYIPVTYTAWSALATVAQGGLTNGPGSQLKPSIFHTANVLLHGASVLLVYAILLLLFSMEWPACAGALLFALHPVQVEPVAWASGMKDLLCGLLALVAIWQYLQHAIHTPVKMLPSGQRWNPPESGTHGDGVLRERSYIHFIFATIAFAAAMLAKPTAIVTPLICFSLDYWILRRPAKRILKPLLFWVLLSVPVIWAGARAQGADAPGAASVIPYVPPLLRPAIAGDAVLFYLGKLIAPWGLAVDYGRRTVVVLNNPWLRWDWLLPLAIAGWIVIRRRKHPWVAAASVVFIAPLLPMLGFKPFLMQYTSTVADHYLYLAMLGPAVAATAILTRNRQRYVAIACTLLFAAFLIRSARQVTFWKDDETLCRHTLFVNPDSFTAHINLGEDLKKRGEWSAARDQFFAAVTENPQFPMAHRNLALAEINLKNWDSMEQHGNALMALERPLPPAVQRQFAADYALIGKQFIYRSEPQRAIPFLQEALRLKPDLAEVRDDLGHARQMLVPHPAATRL